ncbi:MAG: hypothetical protein AB7T49_03015 [Oligoflexales bacterium]
MTKTNTTSVLLFFATTAFLTASSASAKGRDISIAPTLGFGSCISDGVSDVMGHTIGLEFQSESQSNGPYIPDMHYLLTWPLYKYFDLYSFDLLWGEFRCPINDLGHVKLKITGGLAAQWGNKYRLSPEMSFIWKFGVGAYGSRVSEGKTDGTTYVPIIAPTIASGLQYRHTDHLFTWLGARYMHLLASEKIPAKDTTNKKRIDGGLLTLYLQTGYIF